MYIYGHESETRRGSVSVLEHGEKLFGPWTADRSFSKNFRSIVEQV